MEGSGCILVIDDEPQIRRTLRGALVDLADRVVEAETGAQGIDLAASAQPDLVVLDLGLPDISGTAVCLEIRRWATMPILVLSARHSDLEKVALLDAGADDYVTKPFSTRELLARVRAQLRRARAQNAIPPEEPVVVGDLVIDLVHRVLKRDGKWVQLTPIEWNLLRVLVLAAGRTLTHRQLIDGVWGRSATDAQPQLRVHITNLRRKIEPRPSDPVYIRTDPGVGYRFETGA